MYDKCPKILYSKMSDKLAFANSADPDQTAPKGAAWSGSTLFAIPLRILKKELHKKQNLGQKLWNKVFEILGHLPYQPKLKCS